MPEEQLEEFKDLFNEQWRAALNQSKLKEKMSMERPRDKWKREKNTDGATSTARALPRRVRATRRSAASSL